MRPGGKARRPSIPGVCEEGATQPDGMQRRSNADGVAPRAVKGPSRNRCAIRGVEAPSGAFAKLAATSAEVRGWRSALPLGRRIGAAGRPPRHPQACDAAVFPSLQDLSRSGGVPLGTRPVSGRAPYSWMTRPLTSYAARNENVVLVGAGRITAWARPPERSGDCGAPRATANGGPRGRSPPDRDRHPRGLLVWWRQRDQ
jgi:hypothetical protein